MTTKRQTIPAPAYPWRHFQGDRFAPAGVGFFVSMKNKKASSKSAKTQPKFKTSEVKIKGKDVILTGELAAEVQDWVEYHNRCTEPVPGDVTLGSVLRGLVGAPLGKQVEATIVLPADLLAWARNESYQQSGELSDIVREVLEYERYRHTRLCAYARFERKNGGAE